MGYVLLYRDNAGNVQYFNKVWDDESSAYTFAKSHSLNNIMIVSEAEFSAYMAEQQAQSQQQSQQQGSSQQQRKSGYQQHVEIIDDQREPQQEIARPQRPVFMKNYRPAFITFPVVGKKRIGEK